MEIVQMKLLQCEKHKISLAAELGAADQDLYTLTDKDRIEQNKELCKALRNKWINLLAEEEELKNELQDLKNKIDSIQTKSSSNTTDERKSAEKNKNSTKTPKETIVHKNPCDVQNLNANKNENIAAGPSQKIDVTSDLKCKLNKANPKPEANKGKGKTAKGKNGGRNYDSPNTTKKPETLPDTGKNEEKAKQILKEFENFPKSPITPFPNSPNTENETVLGGNDDKNKTNDEGNTSNIMIKDNQTDTILLIQNDIVFEEEKKKNPKKKKEIKSKEFVSSSSEPSPESSPERAKKSTSMERIVREISPKSTSSNERKIREITPTSIQDEKKMAKKRSPDRSDKPSYPSKRARYEKEDMPTCSRRRSKTPERNLSMEDTIDMVSKKLKNSTRNTKWVNLIAKDRCPRHIPPLCRYFVNNRQCPNHEVKRARWLCQARFEDRRFSHVCNICIAVLKTPLQHNHVDCPLLSME